MPVRMHGRLVFPMRSRKCRFLSRLHSSPLEPRRCAKVNLEDAPASMGWLWWRGAACALLSHSTGAVAEHNDPTTTTRRTKGGRDQHRSDTTPTTSTKRLRDRCRYSRKETNVRRKCQKDGEKERDETRSKTVFGVFDRFCFSCPTKIPQVAFHSFALSTTRVNPQNYAPAHFSRLPEPHSWRLLSDNASTQICVVKRHGSHL